MVIDFRFNTRIWLELKTCCKIILLNSIHQQKMIICSTSLTLKFMSNRTQKSEYEEWEDDEFRRTNGHTNVGSICNNTKKYQKRQQKLFQRHFVFFKIPLVFYSPVLVERRGVDFNCVHVLHTVSSYIYTHVCCVSFFFSFFFRIFFFLFCYLSKYIIKDKNACSS